MLISLSAVTHAQLFQNLTIGNAKAAALGNAVTADPPGIDAIHFNPAGLAAIRGRNIQLNGFTALFDVSGEFNSNAAYDQLQEDVGFIDSTADTTSRVEDAAVYLPGKGVTRISQPATLTGGYSYSPPHELFTFGTAVYSKLAGGFIRSQDDPGRFYGERVGLLHLNYFTPTLAWNLTDQLAVGITLNFSYMGAGVEFDYRAPNPVIQLISRVTSDVCGSADHDIVWEGVPVNLCGANEINPFEPLYRLSVDVEESFAYGFNVGLLYEPFNWLTLGFVYQQEIKHHLTGDVGIDLKAPYINLLQGVVDSNSATSAFGDLFDLHNLLEAGGVQATGWVDVEIPRHLSIGASVSLTPKIKANVDFKWTQTSSWDALRLRINEEVPALAILSLADGVVLNGLDIPRNYEDSSNFAFGLEYQQSDRLSFRLGYEPRNSGIPDDQRDFVIPLGNFDLYGLGFSCGMKSGATLDLALSYGRSQQNIPTGSSFNGNDNRGVDTFVFNPSHGLDVKTDTEMKVVQMTILREF